MSPNPDGGRHNCDLWTTEDDGRRRTTTDAGALVYYKLTFSLGELKRYKYLGLRRRNLFLIAPLHDHCLLVHFYTLKWNASINYKFRIYFKNKRYFIVTFPLNINFIYSHGWHHLWLWSLPTIRISENRTKTLIGKEVSKVKIFENSGQRWRRRTPEEMLILEAHLMSLEFKILRVNYYECSSKQISGQLCAIWKKKKQQKTHIPFVIACLTSTSSSLCAPSFIS